MTIGFDEPRPKKENYENFEKKLVDGISKLNIEGLSLMFYGSYARKTAVYGRSDIDGILIFTDDVIINKKDLLNVSEVIAYALEGNNVPLQFTTTDLTTLKEGTFNTYDNSYFESFKKDGQIVVGPDYRNEFNFVKEYLRQHSSIKHNIRKSRTHLLMHKYYENKDYGLFIDKFNKSLDAIINCTKQIILTNERFDSTREKFSTNEIISIIYPDVDINTLEELKIAYKEPDKLDRIYQNRTEVVELWCKSVTSMEQLLKSHITYFSQDMSQELADLSKGVVKPLSNPKGHAFKEFAKKEHRKRLLSSQWYTYHLNKKS